MHSVRRRDVQSETHMEKLITFDALQRSEVTFVTAGRHRTTPENNSERLCLQALQTVPEDQRSAVHRRLQRHRGGRGRAGTQLPRQQAQLLQRTRRR